MLQMLFLTFQHMMLNLLCMVISYLQMVIIPIPIFGLDGMMSLFGSNRDIGVYPLHIRLDKRALPKQAAATALLPQTLTRFIPKTSKQAQESQDSRK